MTVYVFIVSFEKSFKKLVLSVSPGAPNTSKQWKHSTYSLMQLFVSRCLEPLMKHSSSFLIYYFMRCIAKSWTRAVHELVIFFPFGWCSGTQYLTCGLFVCFFSLGSLESEEASHIECDHCQCHIWSLLDHRIADLHPKLPWHPLIWLSLIRYFWHLVHVELCYQPICLCPAEWAF